MTAELPQFPPYPSAVPGTVRAGHDNAVIKWIAEFNTQVEALNDLVAQIRQPS